MSCSGIGYPSRPCTRLRAGKVLRWVLHKSKACTKGPHRVRLTPSRVKGMHRSHKDRPASGAAEHTIRRHASKAPASLPCGQAHAAGRAIFRPPGTRHPRRLLASPNNTSPAKEPARLLFKCGQASPSHSKRHTCSAGVVAVGAWLPGFVARAWPGPGPGSGPGPPPPPPALLCHGAADPVVPVGPGPDLRGGA